MHTPESVMDDSDRQLRAEAAGLEMFHFETCAACVAGTA